jgi:Protein of unknown function (DUF2752)
MISCRHPGGSDEEQMNAAHAQTAGRPRVIEALGLLRAGPTGVLVRAAAVGLASIAVAWLHAAHDPGVLCPLRRLTGIPCPLCGSTTVFIEAGSGSLRGAFLANPVTFLAAAGLIVAPLGPGRWWWRAPYRFRHALVLAAIVTAWTWQLARFDFLPH